MCGSPAYAEMRFDPSKGVLAEQFNVPVADARSETGVCGPEAILFEPEFAPIAVGKAVAKGGWYMVRLVAFSIAALLFLSWLLR
jgi:hypothetical protein